MNFSTPKMLLDGQLAYYRAGRGPDVVMVHGWPLSAATFRNLVPLLSAHYTLHLFDLPGTGNSRGWQGRIGLAEHAVTLERAVDELRLVKYALVAHDSGGSIARLLAAADPRVQALVIGNTEIPGHIPWQLKVYGFGARHPTMAALMFSAMRLGFVRRSSLGFGGCFADARYVDGEFGQLFVEPLLSSREVANGQMALVRNLDWALIDQLEETHARIAAPVRFIWGTDDPFFPIARARKMLPQLRSAELVEIPGAKLFAHEDHAEAFAAHTLPFLARHLSGGESRALDDDLVVQRA
jgi:haloalkane dehalogenase